MLVKWKRTISLALALVILMAMGMLTIPQAAMAANTEAVDGRILAAGTAGDSSDWIEIARNGRHSLIVRKNVLPLGWVNYPTYGTNGNYQVSNARNVVNNWFNNALGAAAGLRDFTVTSDVYQNLGYFAVPLSGISAPTRTLAGTGDDVAFLLSFGEAAQFCSLTYAAGGADLTPSSAVAKKNYGKLAQLPTSPVQRDCWWLRTPGVNSSAASFVGTYDSSMIGAVWSSPATSSSNSSYNYIRPALWVESGIFDVATPKAGGVKNAYVNGSHTAQNGSASNYKAVDPDDTITYELKFDKTNYSSADAFSLEGRRPNAVIVDVLPNGLSYVSHTTASGAVFSMEGQTCTWTWQELPSVNVTVTVTASVDQAAYREFVNRASLTIDEDVQYTNYTYHKIRSFTRTVTGLVSPMASDGWEKEIHDDFLEAHKIIVELRPTSQAPASDPLRAIPVATDKGVIGRFTFENVPFGDYILHISRTGYLARSIPVSITDSSPEVVTPELQGSAGSGVFDLWWGDCNGDGCINYEDVLLVSDLMNVISSSPNYNPACDLNSDRRIDNEDILLVLEMLGKTIADYPGSDMADPLP
jgi:uncharacterized repeat protein (TIGR01451 family)